MREYISLGGGVQSTAMTLMSILGKLDPTEAAVFADTGWERDHTYSHLEWMTNWAKREHGYSIHTVQKGNIKADTIKSRTDIPFFSRKPSGKIAMLKRQCTGHYKIGPVNAKVREINGGINPPVTMWIGFTTDEIVRVNPNPKRKPRWITLRFPLIEEKMSRSDCETWLKDNKFRIPGRSACVCCPFQTNNEWKSLSSAEFKEACRFDEWIRHRNHNRLKHPLYLHRSGNPLRMLKGEGEPVSRDRECDSGGCWL